MDLQQQCTIPSLSHLRVYRQGNSFSVVNYRAKKKFARTVDYCMIYSTYICNYILKYPLRKIPYDKHIVGYDLLAHVGIYQVPQSIIPFLLTTVFGFPSWG